MPGRQIWVLALGAFLVMTGISLVAPILPLYAREFGVNRTAAGALVSSFAVARLAFNLGGGVLADRWGARRSMVAGAMLLSISSVGAALAPSYAFLVVMRILEGAGSAAYATSAMSIMVIKVPKERLGRAIAVYQTGLMSGIAVGPLIGGKAAELGDFATPFWIYAVMGLLVALVVGTMVEPIPPSERSMGDLYRSASRLLRSKPFLALMFVTFALFVMRAGARVTLIPLYGSEELGLLEGQIGTLLSISALFNLLLLVPGGWAVDRIGRLPVLAVGLTASAVTIGLHGFVGTYAGLLVLSSVYGLFGALASLPPPTMAGDLAPPGEEGAAVGIYRAAGDLGLVAGPLMVGALADTGDFVLAFAAPAALLGLAAVMTIATLSRDRAS